MVWIRRIFCRKLWCDFVARTFALIAPVLTVLQWVSSSSKTVPNAPKQKETHENLSLVSNRVDWEHSLQNFRRAFLAWTFALITQFRLILRRVSCSRKMVPNVPTQNKTHLNMSFGPMVWIGSIHCEKFWYDFVALFALIATVWPILHRVWWSRETVPTALK